MRAPLLRGERPGDDWDAHGFFERWLQTVVDGVRLRERLLKQRWRHVSGNTCHSRPPDDVLVDGGHMQRGKFYIGIDWATEKHALCVTDAERHIIKERSIPNDIGLFEIIFALIAGASSNEVFVAIACSACSSRCCAIERSTSRLRR